MPRQVVVRRVWVECISQQLSWPRVDREVTGRARGETSRALD